VRLIILLFVFLIKKRKLVSHPIYFSEGYTFCNFLCLTLKCSLFRGEPTIGKTKPATILQQLTTKKGQVCNLNVIFLLLFFSPVPNVGLPKLKLAPFHFVFN
jgi:hypothetical protein